MPIAEVAPYRAEAENLERVAEEKAVRATTLPDMLREALTKKYTTENPLIAQRNAAATTFLSEGERAAQELLPSGTEGVVFSPTERRSLISGRRAAASVPLMGLNEMIGLSFGGIPNIVDSATRAFNAEVLAASGAAQRGRQRYQDFLNEFLQGEQLKLQRAAVSRAGAPSAGERAANEIRQLIQEAQKLPEDQRRSYILSNGYNPDMADFSGLFTPGPDIEKEYKGLQSEKLRRELYPPQTNPILDNPLVKFLGNLFGR
jgi:hypothetical protein